MYIYNVTVTQSFLNCLKMWMRKGLRTRYNTKLPISKITTAMLPNLRQAYKKKDWINGVGGSLLFVH